MRGTLHLRPLTPLAILSLLVLLSARLLSASPVTLTGRLWEGASRNLFGGPSTWVVIFSAEPTTKSAVFLGYAHADLKGNFAVPVYGSERFPAVYVAAFSENLLDSLYLQKVDMGGLKGTRETRNLGDITTSLEVPRGHAISPLAPAQELLRIRAAAANARNGEIASEVLRQAKALEVVGLPASPPALSGALSELAASSSRAVKADAFVGTWMEYWPGIPEHDTHNVTKRGDEYQIEDVSPLAPRSRISNVRMEEDCLKFSEGTSATFTVDYELRAKDPQTLTVRAKGKSGWRGDIVWRRTQ